MRPVRCLCAIGIAVGLVPLVACGKKPGIHVVSASYGVSCGAPAGNATVYLKMQCEGQDVCDYVIDFKVLGDPKPNCAKDYEARWTCGGSSEVHSAKVPGEAGFETHLQLACAVKK